MLVFGAHLQSPLPAFGERHQRGLRAAPAAPKPAQAENRSPSSILPPFPWVPGRRVPKSHRCGLPVAQAFQYKALLWCRCYDSAQRSSAGIWSPCLPAVMHSMCLCHVHTAMSQYPVCHCPTCLVVGMAEPIARLGSYQRPRDISSNGRDTDGKGSYRGDDSFRAEFLTWIFQVSSTDREMATGQEGCMSGRAGVVSTAHWETLFGLIPGLKINHRITEWKGPQGS